MKKLITIIFLTLSFLSSAEINIDSSNIKPVINEPFNIEIKFINEDKKDYSIEGIENLKILSKSTHSKTSIINGRTTKEKSDIYTVIATEVKDFSLSVKDSNKLNISVQKEENKTFNDNMLFEPSLKNNDSFYFGEKIVYEENFITTEQINSLGYVTQPSFNDFSERDLSPSVLTGNYEQSFIHTPSGKKAIKINLYRGILSSNSSGEKTIVSGQIGVTQSIRQHDFFFEESTPPKYFGHKNIQLNILPLPVNKPENFQNIIGKPELEYSWNRDNINFGETIVLNVKISGNVNLDLLEKIINNISNKDFNTFETLKNKKEDIISGKYYSEKSFEIAFIPKKVGEIFTPEIIIPYFDTQEKIYKSLVVPKKKIEVIGNTSLLNNSNNNISDKVVVANNLEPKEEIKIESLGESSEEKINNKNYNYIIMGLIFISVVEFVVILTLLLKRNKKLQSYDFSTLKNAKDDKEFYEAYCNFMKNKFNFSPKVHLEDKLTKLGLSFEFIKINRELEEAYYNNSPIDRKNILKRIKKEIKNDK